jgi:hypothetical protein
MAEVSNTGGLSVKGSDPFSDRLCLPLTPPTELTMPAVSCLMGLAASGQDVLTERGDEYG